MHVHFESGALCPRTGLGPLSMHSWDTGVNDVFRIHAEYTMLGASRNVLCVMCTVTPVVKVVQLRHDRNVVSALVILIK